MNTVSTPNRTSAKVKSNLNECLGQISQEKIEKNVNLPGDILSDLQDAFGIYDPENRGIISPADFKIILQ